MKNKIVDSEQAFKDRTWKWHAFQTTDWVCNEFLV